MNTARLKGFGTRDSDGYRAFSFSEDFSYEPTRPEIEIPDLTEYAVMLPPPAPMAKCSCILCKGAP